MYKILIYLLLSFGIYGIILYVGSKSKIEFVNNIQNTSIIQKIKENIKGVNNRNLLNKYNKYLTTTSIVGLSLILSLISFIIFFIMIKVISTAIILSIPPLLFPTFFLKYIIKKEKSQIINILPMYVINIKNHITEENNIIKAMKNTNVEEPLKKYIDIFNLNIDKGMNVIKAMNILDNMVNIKQFSDYITACKACYTNGGNFTFVLEKYIEIITKENINKETTKEKAYSSTLTLGIMTVLNVIVIFAFVFTNKEYANIIQNTFMGHVILDINALSYMLIAYFIFQIYKEE